MKRVRMLLRVSSEKQLEADGDLSIQRAILQEYIASHEQWFLDDKEYFEGSKSAYKHTSSQREVLQEILEDAKQGQFDILVLYKDDRVGRLMWDTPAYIMKLKTYGVDVCSVKDGCISPEENDILGQMMLAFRYANAQKSSADTGMRVKDTAQKLVEQGKFMGGNPPYGYVLAYSGEISKQGRALKDLVPVSKYVEVVQYIYELYVQQEYGSARIAKTLNLHPIYRYMAPKDVWKAATVTSILTNPIYAGYMAYKRRERQGGSSHRLDCEKWILSRQPRNDLIMIDQDLWNQAQTCRKERSKKGTIHPKQGGALSFLDVMYCGICKGKMTNGSKYNYWTIRDTGEKKSSKVAVYKCQTAWQGVPHEGKYQVLAKEIEPILWSFLSKMLDRWWAREMEGLVRECERKRMGQLEEELEQEKQREKKVQRKLEIMKEQLPLAMEPDYPICLEELVQLIQEQKEILEEHRKRIREKEKKIETINHVSFPVPSWETLLQAADGQDRKRLVHQLVERIEVKEKHIYIRMKLEIEESGLESLIKSGFGVPKPGV